MAKLMFIIGLPLRLFAGVLVYSVTTMLGDEVDIRWWTLLTQGIDRGINPKVRGEKW